MQPKKLRSGVPLFPTCRWLGRLPAFEFGLSSKSPINMVLIPVKTTVEIPDDLFKRAKVLAAQEGLSMKQLITESLQQRVGRHSTETALEPVWKRAFGAMRMYRKENRRIEKIIEQEFEQVEPEDRR